MNRNKCRIILDITETFSFTKTASRLGYTQSAVSQAVRSAESMLGIKLFSRNRSSVSLTPEGRELVPFFKNICAAYDNLFDNAKSIKNIDGGNISIGCPASFSAFCLPKLISGFCENYPNVTYELTCGGASALIEAVEKGCLDFAIIYGKAPGELYSIKLTDFVPVTVFASSCDFKTHRGISASRDEIPYASFDGNDELHLLSSRMASAEKPVVPKISVPDIGQLLPLIRLGVAAGVLPDFAAEELACQYPEILFKKEETGIFKIPVHVIFKSFNEISRTGKCFLDLLANVYCGS